MSDKSTSERLIEAAIDIFSSKGYSGTGVDEIAGSIGIKGPNIYKYFNGKKCLLENIVSRANHDYNYVITSTFKAATNIVSGSSLKAFTMDYIERLTTNDLLVKYRRLFTIEQFRDEEFAIQATKHQMNIFMEVFIQIFGELIDHGIMVKGKPRIYALDYCSPLSILIQMCDREPEKKEDMVRLMVEHIDFFIDRFFQKNT
ncbi:MAG: TetR/AcrR family transcriptional regulator [Lachnospiraceae bacterium]|nr:TetR/AcrR family transcriptional regulator [Lachnospiraceae bacterium]